MSPRTIQIRIPSTYADCAVVREVLPLVAAGMPFSRRTLLQLEICLAEALHNVVRHGYAGRDDGTIDVSFRIFDARLEIEIVDRGAPMPEPARRSIAGADRITARAERLADLPEGGFGIPILRTVLDDVAYRRDGDRNILTMTKHAREESAASA